MLRENMRSLNENTLEERSDADLIAQAQNGEREAFGELFRRHHAKAHGWARSLVRDTHTADDIVQEALIKAFLHLGTLMNAERFLPWLHRIVKNQAYDKLKSSQRELPFSILLPHDGGREEDANWRSIDRILYRLHKRNKLDSPDGDPAVRLVRNEWYETMLHLLQCLTKRERDIFESYFFEQLTPKEIAELFRTTTDNVYMVLSRSKKKITLERIRSDLNLYLSQRRLGEKMARQMLKKPRVLHWKSPVYWSHEPWTTAGFNLYGLLEATGKSELPVSTVLGLTGQSFRLNIVKETIHTAGATLYDWNRVIPSAMRNLGFSCSTVGGPSGQSFPRAAAAAPSGEALTEALAFIQSTLDQGHYVMSFDLTLPEFGIIYGYNDDRRELYVGDVNVSFHRKPEEDEGMPYERLGRMTTNTLFALSITGQEDLTQEEALAGAIRSITEHANGSEPAFENCANGLQAYEAWIAAFEGGAVDDAGNSYTTELVHDARKYAALFLRETANDWSGLEKAKISALLSEAASSYESCAQSFRELCRMFPFAGNRLPPNDRSNASAAIKLLREAKAAEEEGLTALQEIGVILSSS